MCSSGVSPDFIREDMSIAETTASLNKATASTFVDVMDSGERYLLR